MEERTDGPYYHNRNAYEYSSLPAENAECFALDSQVLDYGVQQYHRRAAEYDSPADIPYYSNQLGNNADQYKLQDHDFPMQRHLPHHAFADQHSQFQDHAYTMQRHLPDHAFADQHRYQDHDFPMQRHLPHHTFADQHRFQEDETTIEDDAVSIKQIVKEEAVSPSHSPEIEEEEEEEEECHHDFGAEANDEANYEVEEPAPAPDFPANVAPHELKYSTKERRGKMSIYHRREFAYVECAMTIEEHFQIKGLNHVAPQTFSIPDKNGKYQKRKRIRITWAERDILNAWRIENGIKPHVLRKGAKYAAARDYWRLHAPHVVPPRKTKEWSSKRGPVPAP